MNKRRAGNLLLGIALLVFFTCPVEVLSNQNSGLKKICSISQAKIDRNNDYIPDKLGDTVTIAGRATVSSGVLMKDMLLIAVQDSSAGIFIYQPSYSGPKIKAGDSLMITGVISQYYGVTEITSPHIIFIDSSKRKIPKPIPLLYHSSESNEGRIVSIKARIIDKSSNNGGKFIVVSLAGGSDSTLIVFNSKNSENPNLFNNISNGEVVQITGIFSQHDFNPKPNGYYQLLPRSKDDLTIIEHNASYYLIIIGGITMVVLISLLFNFLMRRKVVQRTKELNIAKEKAEESDRLKTAFLANMSHEIRTPMNGILGFTELLKTTDLSSDEKNKFIEIIHESGKRMLGTVNDIVEISKIETGLLTVKAEPVDLNQTLKDLVKFFQPEASGKGLSLHIEKLILQKEFTIVTDKHKFESILSNLIKNAIKYTPSGEIKMGYFLEKENVEFYIIDPGIGISESRQDAIFDHFVQEDIEDKKAFGGSGLGLSISKAYAEVLGGRLWLSHSKPGRGSEFRLSLPLGSLSDVIINRNAQEQLKESPKNLVILIAEDDDFSYQYLFKLLKHTTNEILWAKNGKEAVEELKRNPKIDLIMMDILMPEMNGFEATRQIREFNKDVVIIAQTAFAALGEKERILAAGCNDYLSKPILHRDFKKMIAKYF